MAGSLTDQLLNLGVASKKQAHQAKSSKNKKAKARKAGNNQVAEEAAASPALSAQEAKQAKAARDRELNKQREEAKARKAAEAEVQQLIEQHAVPLDKQAEIAYNFVHGSKVKKLYVAPLQQEQLAKGTLAIAVDGDNYRLVPQEIAERIAQRDASRVIITRQDDADPDDPYADYQIPDDLMW